MRGNVIHVESRDQIVDRIGRSPDWGTAYILAQIVMPKERDMALGQGGGAERRLPKSASYDPLELMRQRRGR